jgi:hypothetical protein
MKQRLVRHFDMTAQPHQLLWLAGEPHLAPRYLNFLTDIRHLQAQVPMPAKPQGHNWRCFQVWVQYRNILKTEATVYLRVDPSLARVYLNHDGGLAQFDAAFQIDTGQVTLTCDYQAKVPLVSWLIAKVLDRALSRVAQAMDRYAATLSDVPT